MENKPEFVLYLTALWKHWWALMSCAVFTGIAIYVAATNKGNGWLLWALVIASILLFIWASFLAWQDEHRAMLSERSKNEKPDIRGEIREFYAVTDRGSAPEGCDCFAILKVYLVNHSQTASTIKDYALSMTTNGGLTYHSVAKLSTSTWDLAKDSVTRHGFATGTRQIQERPFDLSTSVAMAFPLQRGDGKEGWLAFCIKVDGKEDENLEALNVILTLTDALGNQHNITGTSPWKNTGIIIEHEE
jgi:hypothetical protein